ncbi:MAG TPA: hypothetical protein VI997_11175 [Candidatus Thermoplasmatota archaeon]|nr:hypothetical protein [Candidatus Thermoplasmatota archaeon]
MAAFGLKVGIVATAGLLALLPAFNSLNQVTVEDVDPPLTVENPPPNLPPPKDGDDELEMDPEEGPSPQSPECPPPVAEEVFRPWTWTFPPQLPTGESKRFAVSPGSIGLVWVGNLSNFVGTITFSLVDPEGGPREIYHWASADDGGAAADVPIGPGEVKGAVPGQWQWNVAFGDAAAPGTPGIPFGVASGHADFQLYQVFPCGGIGRE